VADGPTIRTALVRVSPWPLEKVTVYSPAKNVRSPVSVTVAMVAASAGSVKLSVADLPGSAPLQFRLHHAHFKSVSPKAILKLELFARQSDATILQFCTQGDTTILHPFTPYNGAVPGRIENVLTNLIILFIYLF
jgi:hypothetical protein